MPEKLTFRSVRRENSRFSRSFLFLAAYDLEVIIFEILIEENFKAIF